MSTSEQNNDEKSNNSFLNWPAHPFLLATFPVVSLYGANFGDVPLREFCLPISIALATAAHLLCLLRLLGRSWQRAALATSFCVALFFLFRHGHKGLFVLTHLSGLPSSSYGAYFFIWSVVAAAGFALLLMFPRDTRPATRLLNIFGILLLAIVIGNSFRSVSRYVKVRWSATSSDVDVQLQVTEDSPDIYYLVFDRYGGLDCLQENFGIDNRPFYEQLRQRDFFCAEHAHANYPRTKISMASALNMRLLQDPIYEDQVALIRNHSVGRSLRVAGYEYFHLGNWYGPVGRSDQASYNWPVSPYPSYFTERLWG